MYCYKCGSKLRDDANFCIRCGHSVNEENKRSESAISERLICGYCGRELEAGTQFCDQCGKSVTETSEEYYENYITEDNEIPVMSKLPSFFKEKKNIMIVGASVLAVALIFLSGNMIPDRNSSKTEVTNNNNETADVPVTEGSTAAVSETTAVEETAYAVTVAPPPEDRKEINYEELYNNYIRELAGYYGVASQNPFMQYPTCDIYDMHPVPSESFGLVSAYQSDMNHDEVKDLIAVSFINDDSYYIWRTQCFSVNENKEIYQVSRYDYKIEKKYTSFRNRFMKAEIVDGYIVYSCSYCHYEGRTKEVVILKLSDLSLNKAGIINAYSLGGTSISIDGLKVNFNLNYQGISANDRTILSEDKVNNTALNKFCDLGINCTKVSLGGETDLEIWFDTSYVLLDYSGSTGSKVFYPQEYTGLYSLLGLTKEYKVLEAKALAKNPAPVTSSRSFRGYVDIDYGVLNLRYRPNTDSEILAGIPKDTKLTLQPSDKEGWYYTYYGSNWGYVSADFIAYDPEFTTTAATSRTTKATTTRITSGTTVKSTTSNTTAEETTICETTPECVTEPPVTIPPVPDDTQPPEEPAVQPGEEYNVAEEPGEGYDVADEPGDYDEANEEQDSES